MIFTELSYFAVFLVPCVVAFHLAARLGHDERTVAIRAWALILFGLGFFAYFGYRHFGGALGALAVLIFVWELIVSRWYRPGSVVCLLGIAQAILILVVFKYLHFFGTSWNDLATLRGGPVLSGLPRLALPLGISFFTFEFIHFAADSYTGKIVRPPLAHYAAFIFFFPSMVAGPIKRFQDFEPQFLGARFDPGLVMQGITRILAGLVKKNVIADTFGLWADPLTTDALYRSDGLVVLLRVFAYGMKIYFDFSGYSDIAIGSGYLFGIRIPENFSWPYLSANITEFWRRWHISLGRWLFDYVYVPLGGSRHGRGRTALALVVTFAISGLWHGAGYGFLAWGVWHGLMMLVHRVWRRTVPASSWRLAPYMATALTFVAVNIGWAFFFLDARRAVFALGRITGVN